MTVCPEVVGRYSLGWLILALRTEMGNALRYTSRKI